MPDITHFLVFFLFLILSAAGFDSTLVQNMRHLHRRLWVIKKGGNRSVMVKHTGFVVVGAGPGGIIERAELIGSLASLTEIISVISVSYIF